MIEAEQYQVLARRTRPQAFADLVGQENVAAALTHMLDSKRIHHAFLLTGTRGTGKTSSARILAKALCCVQGPTASPCQVCSHCKQITACAHEDVLEIDGASNTGVDNVRELRESARFYPSSAKYKVYIIDEVHMLTQQAFNALLKTLEEPPAQVVFILATTEIHKVPLTVRSRCVTFSFHKVAPEVISLHLGKILAADGFTFDEDALALIAREAKGSIRDSLSLLEQVRALSETKHIATATTRDALSILGQELAEGLMQAIVTGTVPEALDVLRKADAASLDLALLLSETAQQLRHAFVLRYARDGNEARRLTELLPGEITRANALCGKVPVAALSEMFRLLSNATHEVGRSATPLPWAEVFVLDCMARREWLSATELLNFVGTEKKNELKTPVLAPKPTEIPQALPTQNTASQNTNSQNIAPQNIPLANTGVARFKDVIAQVEKRSVMLAGKLRQVVVLQCEESLIEFSTDAAHSMFTRLSANEATVLTSALGECGLGKAKIVGLQLPTEIKPQVEEKKNDIAPPPEPTRGRTVAAYEIQEELKSDKEQQERILKDPKFQQLIKSGSQATVYKVKGLN